MATFPSEQIDVTMTINADEEEAKVDSSGVVVAVKNSDGEENIDDEDDKDDDGEEEEDGVLEEASDTVDDDPVAEGEEHRMPKPEPSEEKANSTKFYTLCLAMEQVWEASVKNKKWSDLQKLWKILPPKVLSWLSEPIEGSNRPESVFPIMRLLLPDKDGSRQFQLAESTLGLLYGGALGLSQQSHKLQMLLHFTDRNIVRTQADGRGDFSVVVQRVVETTKAKGRASGYTVGAMNAALDVLASLPGKLRSIKSNHDWRPTSSEQSGRVVGKKSKGPTLKDLRIQWLKRLNEGTDTCHGLSPLEHKWLVRILLKKLQFGLGWKKLLQWYNPYAAMLWSAHNSLKGICDKICDPEFAKARDFLEREQRNASSGSVEQTGLDSYMPKSLVAPQFGVIFSPMLSERTGFARVLDDISSRHRAYIQSEEARRQAPNIGPDCLSFKHPAFSVEPKLDGERFLVHISRHGVIKMHTRRGNWYSELYSPVLGPPLRRAVKEGFDVILDGEIISWDSVRAEVVPFGSNRTIASLRKDWMRERGLLDARDQGMHDNDNSAKSMNAANSWTTEKVDTTSKEVGAECWLQLVVFDILYVDGPKANEFLSEAVSRSLLSGSLIHLETMERRKILYKMIEPQPTEVEIVQSWIVRPNGSTELGENYFHPQSPIKDGCHEANKLDSLYSTLNKSILGLSEIDQERRHGRSDEQISEARAQAVQSLYDIMVDEQRLEGLIFKDLSAPYYLGEESKSMRYWHKFKPDYFNGSMASDLDVVVIGGYYATGRKQSGKPSGLLCACVDSEDSERFFPVCKVSLLSIDRAQSNELLAATGYPTDNDDGNDETENINRWEKADRLSKSTPDFVSMRSYQTGNDNNGWRVQKKDYPNLWIHPQNSVILTLNAGEIVESDAFSAGITLRFPRIVRVRHDANSKDSSDIESELSLWEKYRDVQNSRSMSTSSTFFEVGSPDTKLRESKCRFLTEKQYDESRKKRNRKSGARRKLNMVSLPVVPQHVSSIFKDVTFAVLGQTGYKLDKGSTDMDQAREEGWLDEGIVVSDANSVYQFIKKHGGRYKISADIDCTLVLGGSHRDPKVETYIRAIEYAQSQAQGKKGKTKKALELEKIAQCKGVVRWTFVYSVVCRWLASGRTKEESVAMMEPERLTPSVLDYVASPFNSKEGFPRGNINLSNVDLSHLSSMRRALALYEESQKQNPNRQGDQVLNWRKNCNERLDVDKRWVVACDHQTLWPYKQKCQQLPLIQLYPDIFQAASGTLSKAQLPNEEMDDRWTNVSRDLRSSYISSVLPLARVMGAVVVSRLHDSVTHVLCDLREGIDEVVFDCNVKSDLFSDCEQGSCILGKLRDLQAERLQKPSAVLIISPQWIRKRKWRD